MHQRWLVYQVVAVSAPRDIFVFHFGCTPDRVPLQMASLLGAIATLDALKKSNQRSLSWPVIDEKRSYSARLMIEKELE